MNEDFLINDQKICLFSLIIFQNITFEFLPLK